MYKSLTKTKKYPKLEAHETRLAKCRQISIFAMPVAFTGKCREIMENTGKYDLQP